MAISKAPIPLSMCGLAASAAVLGDRWTLLVLREAFYGLTRFEDLRDDLGISRQSLSVTLKRMVAHGLLSPVAYRVPGARTRTEYELTAHGRALGPALFALMRWGDSYVRKAPAPVALVDALTGESVVSHYVTDSGRIVPDDGVALRILNQD